MGGIRTRRSMFVLGGLLTLLVAVVLGGIAVGSESIPFGDVIRVLLRRLHLLAGGSPDPAPDEIAEQIVVVVRLPRVLLGVLVGYGLSAAGGVMQGVFRNPLADPYLLGIAGGATAGAATSIAFLSEGAVSVSIGAFCGGVVAVTIVYRLSLTRLGRLSDYTLVLAGIAIGALFSAATSLIIYFSKGDELQQIIFWMMGSLARATPPDVFSLCCVVVLGGLIVQVFARDLNALMLGDDTAMHLGVDPQILKKILLLVVTLMTTMVISVAGTIGFVGLIVPHTMRLLLGPDHRLLLPASGLAGGAFLVVCDTVARTVVDPLDIPVGIITAIFGAPFLLYLLRRPRAGTPYGPGGRK